MTEKDFIDVVDYSAAAAKDAGRDRKDRDYPLKDRTLHLKPCAVHQKNRVPTLKHCAIALKDRTLHLKDAALTLKRCAAAERITVTHSRCKGCMERCYGKPSKVWALNGAAAGVTMKERGLTPRCAPHNVKVHDGD